MGRIHRRGRLLALLVTVATVALSALAVAATPTPALAAHGGRPAPSASTSRRAQATKKHAPAKKHKPSPRPLPLKMIWGPLSLPNGSSAFPTYHHLGVQVLELQLVWSSTAPTRPGEPTNPLDPAYRWPPEIEQAISQAARWGIKIALLVKGTPGWANGGLDSTWAPSNPADYANFMQAASRRYPTVRYWMIWGEPNGPNFNPMPANSPVGPKRYALLLDAAYGALKAVTSSNVVIGGMTWTAGPVRPPDFIRWMRLPDGAPPRLDYYGQNPYSTRFPKLEGPPFELAEGVHLKRGAKPPRSKLRDINDIETLHNELAVAYRHRPGGTPKLWLSEFSISTDSPNYAFAYFVSRPVQALWVTAAFKLVDSAPYVAGFGWYELLDQPASVPGHLTEGLLTAEGTPKPSFNAYARAP
jgi:hypothetical protein